MRDVQSRVTWLLALLTAGLLLTVFQLYRLTADSGAWQSQAEENLVRTLSSHSPRGAIFDRNGRALATSEPAFAAILVKQDPQFVEQMIPKLSLLLSGGDEQRAREMAERVRRRVQENRVDHRQFEPITIARTLDPAVVSAFMERRSEFAGVSLVIESTRNYPLGKLAGSVLGYVGVISSSQLKQPGFDKYSGDEVVGKDGLEAYYEQALQGTKGQRTVKVDQYGRPIGEFAEAPATPGNNLTLTLDMDLQRVAEQALVTQMEWIKKQDDKEANPIRASAVVIDVRTGAVLAMASVPTFDPNLFASLSDAQWEELVSLPAQPLRNWALAGYAPGSIYKMAVGLAALELKQVQPYERIDCPTQYWDYHKPKNWTPYNQGPADVARALAISCDPYFYEVGHRMGVDKMAEFLSRFGFGQPTNIDLPGEQPGILPTRASYGERWMPGNVLSVSIGQGDVLVTPLQLARYTATVANGGTVHRPYLVAEVRSPAGDLIRRSEPVEEGHLQASPESIRRIQEGMRQAVTSQEGTAHRPFDGFPYPVAAKTGSAETGYAWANALTVAYAPYDKPEVAVAVVVEGGSHGSWVAPAARAMLAQYYGLGETHDPGRAIKAD